MQVDRLSFILDSIRIIKQKRNRCLNSPGNCIDVDNRSEGDADEVNSYTNIDFSQFLVDYNDIVKQTNIENQTYPGPEKATG